jgi:hypothetical protein
MRVKHVFVGAALAAALVIPAAVFAATPQQLFVGELDGQTDSSVKLKTGATNGYRVKAFGAHDFAVACKGETTEGMIKRSSIKGRIAIGREGRFHARDDNGQTVVNLRGKVDGRKASGIFRFSGVIEDADGTKHECDSGRLDWTARATGQPDIGP